MEAGILLALLVVLIIVVVLRPGGHCRCRRCQSREPFTDASVSAPSVSAPSVAPNDDLRPVGSYKNIRSLVSSPHALEEAQREAWLEAVSSGDNPYYNPEPGGGSYDEMVHHHTPGASINYQEALVDLVANPKTRARQANWYSEVASKSQTAMTVDTLDEAAAVSSQKGHGMYSFRFPAPSQHNPLFITEQDAETYGEHATKFTFGG